MKIRFRESFSGEQIIKAFKDSLYAEPATSDGRYRFCWMFDEYTCIGEIHCYADSLTTFKSTAVGISALLEERVMDGHYIAWPHEIRNIRLLPIDQKEKYSEVTIELGTVPPAYEEACITQEKYEPARLILRGVVERFNAKLTFQTHTAA